MNYKLEKVGAFRKYKPSYLKNKDIHPGSIVKLIFTILDKRIDINAERVWVKIVSEHKGMYLGIVDNDPLYIDLKEGDQIEFKKVHIYDIYDDI